MTWSETVTTASAEETRALARRLAGAARRGDLVVLEGSLGAGKTTFAQGFARGLGVEGPVVSPTFTLVRQYPCALGQLVHADVYRLDHLAEVSDIGVTDLVEDGIALVEWGNVALRALSPVAWSVEIGTPEGAGGETRTLTVRSDDDARRETFVTAIGEPS